LFLFFCCCCSCCSSTTVNILYGTFRSTPSFSEVPHIPSKESSPTVTLTSPDVKMTSSVGASDPHPTPAQSYGSSKLTVMMIGRHSSGKSTLMEGLIGQSITSKSDEGDQFTMKTFDINSVHLTLSFLRSMKEDLNVEELQSHVKGVHLAMYAIRMDDSRARPADIRFLRKLHKMFGRVFWNKAIFVLTFANRVQVLDRNHVLHRSETHYKEKIVQWKKFIHKILLEEGLSKAEVQDIPVVPVGYSSEPVLFDHDWTVDFVNGMYKRLTEDSEGALNKICKYC